MFTTEIMKCDVISDRLSCQKNRFFNCPGMSDPVINLYDELPDFANQENREKHAVILQKTRELDSLKGDCQDLQERVRVLQDHLKSVQNEVQTTQQLLTAKKAQVEEEKHLRQLCDREHGKIVSEMAKVEEEAQKVMTKVDQVQGKIVISQKRIGEFKEQAKMNEQELEQWIVVARQKEEDFLVLQRYQKEDEGKVKGMIMEIEKAAQIINAKKAELEQEITKTKSLQIELDTTAEQFRKLHEERAQLLSQWEATMQQMRTLNEAIERTTEGFDARKGEVERLHGEVAEETKNLDLAVSQNQAIERQFAIYDHQVNQRHKALEKETADLGEFAETVETQRHQLEKLESDQRAYQEEIDNLRNLTAREREKREVFAARLKETEYALSTQKDQTGELVQQTDLMNEFLKKEEVQLKELEKAIEAEKGQIFKLSQEVFEVRKVEKNLVAEIQGSQSRAKNLALRIQEFDRETQKQLELLYNSNFQIQQMERKIAGIEGEKSVEEKIELQQQLEQLTKLFEGKKVTEKMLTDQLQRLEFDLRQTARKKESLEKVKQDLEVKLNDLRLDQESLDKSTVKARTQKESVLVQLNMLRLQVEKLTEQVSTKSDELISLENRRQQLQLSMEERVAEIDGHLAALRTQLKTEEEARHQAIVELTERKKRIDILSAKYEIVMLKSSDGQEMTQAERIAKFTKERDEVTLRGDELEEQVKTAIKELRALERQMEKLNAKNSDFRTAFSTVGENDKDVEKKKVLEEQVKVAQGRLNARRAEANAVAEERAAMEQTYQQQQTKITEMQAEINRMKPLIEKLSSENKDLGEKIKRANHMLKKSKDAHRKDANVPADSPYPATLLEMDVELRMMKSTIEATVSELTRVVEGCREMEPKLRLGLTQIGLAMKPMGPSLLQSSSRTPSIVSPSSSKSGSSRKSTGSYRSIGSVGSKGSIVSRGSRASHASQASRGSVASIKNLAFGNP